MTSSIPVTATLASTIPHRHRLDRCTQLREIPPLLAMTKYITAPKDQGGTCPDTRSVTSPLITAKAIPS